jgi:hypothetical protein
MTGHQDDAPPVPEVGEDGDEVGAADRAVGAGADHHDVAEPSELLARPDAIEDLSGLPAQGEEDVDAEEPARQPVRSA